MAQPRKNSQIVGSPKRKTPQKARTGDKKKTPQQNTDEHITRTMWGILVFGLGLFMLACLILGPNATLTRFVFNLLQGAAGFLCYVIPLMVCAAGAVLAFAPHNATNTRRVLLAALLFALVCTCVQLFDIQSILSSDRWKLSAQDYPSFLQLTAIRSSKLAVGGGVIGSLLAYPMWLLLDVWGSLLLLAVFVIMVLVVLTGISFTTVGGSVTEKWQQLREDFEVRREERDIRRADQDAQREVERLREYQYGRNQAPVQEEPQKAWEPEQSPPSKGRSKVASQKQDPKNYGESTQAAYYHDQVEAQQPNKEKPLQRKAGKQQQPSMYIETIGETQAAMPRDGVSRNQVMDFPKKGRGQGKGQSGSQPRVVNGQALYIETLAPQETQGTGEAPEVLPFDAPRTAPGRAAVFTSPFAAPKPPQPEEEDTAAYEDPCSPEEPGASSNASGGDFPWDEEPSWSGASESDPWPWEQSEKPVAVTQQKTAPVEVPVHTEPASFFSRPVSPQPTTPAEQPAAPEERRLDHTPITLPTKEATASAVDALPPYEFPPVNLLKIPERSSNVDTRRQDEENAAKLISTLQSFGIQARVLNVTHGPAITRYELQPAPGVKVSRIVNLVDDIALNMAAAGVRIEAPIPGKAAIGIEIPNDSIATVMLREILEGNEFQIQNSSLACALGKDIAGRHILADLAKMPHVLIAGATGSGKSVCINTLINSIIYRATPDEVRMILIDPKVVELSVYNGVPHLMVPVVTDPKKASGALSWAVVEMDRRYKEFAARGVRDIRGFNSALQDDEPMMPKIVVIIDELADLMMVAPGEVEDSICRLAQLARAAGIHLVIATQRPSVNVITGVIKANIPSRIAFAVSSQVDSRTILDSAGAEKLLGKGDMLYAPQGSGKPIRVQGCFVSDEEVARVVDFVKKRHNAEYDEDVIEHLNQLQNNAAEPAAEESEEVFDELLADAVEIAVESGQASISMLQRRLRVGYARAGRLVDEMARRGIISQAEGAKPREVLMSREEYHRQFEME